MSIANFDEFKPKTATVLVGDKQLQVSEYSIAQRDAVMAIMFDDVNILETLKPMFQGSETELEDSTYVVNIANALRDVMGKGFSKIAQLTLNTATNRTIAKVDDSSMPVWIGENLTVRQEVEVLKAVLDVNDFVETIKKLWALVNPVKE